MGDLFQEVLNWAEVWAMLIPILVLIIKRGRPGRLKPIVIYIWLAFAINIGIDVVMVYKKFLPAWLQSNNPLYNMQSVVRFACFGIFFINQPQDNFLKTRKLLAVLGVLFAIINFIFFDDFFDKKTFSSNLFTVEAFLLMVYCMLYYLSAMRDSDKSIFEEPDFWIVTGLAIYVVVNFFVFLFYIPMFKVDPKLAEGIWNVHNIAFIIFCIFLSKAFYGPFRN